MCVFVCTCVCQLSNFLCLYICILCVQGFRVNVCSFVFAPFLFLFVLSPMPLCTVRELKSYSLSMPKNRTGTKQCSNITGTHGFHRVALMMLKGSKCCAYDMVLFISHLINSFIPSNSFI